MDPVSGTFAGFSLLQFYWAALAVGCSQFLFIQFLHYVRGFLFPHAYFVPCCLVFVLPSFIHAESVHAAILGGFLRYFLL